MIRITTPAINTFAAIVTMCAVSLSLASERQDRFEATHDFLVAAPVAEVFPLFTPEGESRWAPSWNPTPVVPDVIRAEKNAVFLTGKGDDQRIWTIVNFDPRMFTIEYLVVDADYLQVWITVRCSEIQPGESQVSVTYVTTALSDDGATEIRRYDVDFIRQWEDPVRAVVAADSGAP